MFLNIPFFACLSEKELSAIESAFIVKTFTKNQVILSEEEESEYFYFMCSGKIKVLQNNNDKELLLAIHKRGDYFGEMSLLDGKTAPATIVPGGHPKSPTCGHLKIPHPTVAFQA